MTESGLVSYFGYGSLVNRTTHRTEIVNAVPARLRGWRRCWMPRADTSIFNVAILSVRRQAGADTEGLLIIDRTENLPEIDERERNYERRALGRNDIEIDRTMSVGYPAHVYEVPGNDKLSFNDQKILRSYLDAVLQGFLAEHGEAAVWRFVEETEAFDIGILDDRASPLYQRRVSLTAIERELFDDVLGHLPRVLP